MHIATLEGLLSSSIYTCTRASELTAAYRRYLINHFSPLHNRAISISSYPSTLVTKTPIMKHIVKTVAVGCAAFLGMAAAAATPVSSSAQVRPATEPVISYQGYKVVRLPTGDDFDKVQNMVESLGLETWKATHTFADVMVPPEKLEAFDAEMAAQQLTGAETMYEDLGPVIETERQELFASEWTDPGSSQYTLILSVCRYK